VRTFFAPDRTGVPVATDLRNRSPGRWLGLELKGGF
jgi:hypothetical protein